MLGIVGALLLGASLFYIVYTTQMAAETSAAKDRLGVDLANPDQLKKLPIYLKLTRPLLKGVYLDFAKGFWKEKDLAHWKTQIRSAGMHKMVDAEQFVASKFWLTIILSVFTFLFYVFATQPPPPWLALMIIGGAFFLPNMDISSRKTARQLEVRLALPYVMDLLTLSMEAGLEFMGAISRVVERAPPGAFIDELTELLKDIQLGRTRAESLRKMANSLDMPEMTSLVAVLISTDSMGVSIGPVLRAQSETIRLERLVKAEKMGAQASQKILIPMVMFILPAVFLMIFGPILLSMIGAK